MGPSRFNQGGQATDRFLSGLSNVYGVTHVRFQAPVFSHGSVIMAVVFLVHPISSYLNAQSWHAINDSYWFNCSAKLC